MISDWAVTVCDFCPTIEKLAAGDSEDWSRLITVAGFVIETIGYDVK